MLLPLSHTPHFTLRNFCPVGAEKQLRRKLEAEYGCDLADRKALLRAEINAYLQAEEVGLACLGCRVAASGRCC